MTKKRVGVLIVTFNRFSLLLEEIESIRKQSYQDFDIIVVNNDSTDGTLSWLMQQPDIITITQPNLGGAGGFFTGMKYIAENGYEYCWLMDDDVECDVNALEVLLDRADGISDLGFLCSRVFGVSGNLMNVPLVDDRFIQNHYPTWMDRIDDNLIKVKAATFVSVLVPTKNIIKFGLPIKEYYIWGDDYEFTFRLSQSLKSYCAFNSKVIHKRVQQAKLSFFAEQEKVRLGNYYYMLRNTYLNNKQYGSVKDKFINIVYICYLLLYCVIHIDFFRLKIVIKAIWGILKFKRNVVFPSIKQD